MVAKLRDLRRQADSAHPDVFTDQTPLRGPLDGWRYFIGPSACIPPSMLVRVATVEEWERTYPSWNPADTLLDTATVTPELHEFLVQNYLSTVHTLYPILDAPESIQSLQNPTTTSLTASQEFIRCMVYAISCHCVPRNARAMLFLSLANNYHRRAMELLEAATSKLNVETLRNVMLLAFHSMLAPHQGNCSQLVGIAARLCVDLKLATSEDQSLLHLLLSVVCVERQIAVTIDRPWFLDLPDSFSQVEISGLARHRAIEILYILVSMQSTLRQAELEGETRIQVSQQIRAICTWVTSQERPLPNLIAVLQETKLMLGLDGDSKELIQIYNQEDCFHTFLTPHWILRAARAVLERSPSLESGKASREFLLALLMLDRDTVRWPSCQVLLESLQAI
ncbi:hypothetical protein A1O1_01492 [Capronia coronata CBS 617.96]|uniref:Xylanolytic transcriptional activator regulatory domain-containing protein n=1 Tax=Capronia coronata CBS 617.96 TaxID=1182541 RepID=W9Z472_9EURO|nr:uncharacterized protein A1O1_01492 [Capronia coronata CBS 617.96]EXJ96366.1 hypothetical protein A1O1_01492 [Capronia coronata CBS 617.96]